DPTKSIVEAEGLGVAARRRAERSERCHAVLNHPLELPDVVTVRKDADIATEANVDSSRERSLERRTLLDEAGRRLALSLHPSVEVGGIGLGGCYGGAEGPPLSFHELKPLRRSPISVLYRFHPRESCAAHSFSRRRVRRDGPSASMCRLHE